MLDGKGNRLDDDSIKERYNLSQKQRAMERSIRKTKRQLLMKQAEIDGIAEVDVKEMLLESEYGKLSDKLLRQNKAYNDFCRENDLQPDYVRTKTVGFGSRQQKQADTLAKAYRKNNVLKRDHNFS